MLTATRRFAASVLALTLALPAAAAEPKAAAKEQPASKAKPAPSKEQPAPKEQPASAPVAALDAPTREPEPFIRGHRYAYVAGGLLLLGGVGFGYFSRGEARRAESLESARESSAALNRARTAAATANVMYGVAGLTLAYGLLLEFLPEPAADAASLTYHF
jgi:Tfp pilus assembly protein FimV